VLNNHSEYSSMVRRSAHTSLMQDALHQLKQQPLHSCCIVSALAHELFKAWKLVTLCLCVFAGERLSPWVGISCIVMGFSILFT
jgi:hypothetical protein